MSSETATASASAQLAFERYMGQFTEMFGEELYQMHESDANPEMTAALADCVEVGLLVWGNPLRLPAADE